MNGEKSSRPSRTSSSNKSKSASSSSSSSSSAGEKKKKKKKKKEEPAPSEDADSQPRVSTVNPKDVPWENTEATTAMWQLIDRGDIQHIEGWLSQDPDAVHMRSEAGRGPLWWANQAGNQEIIDLLRAKGVRNDLKDGTGKVPRE